MYYAGIGSRDCPDDIGVIMTALAMELESVGYILRSGGARGADTFFELGVQDVNNKEIFIHKEYAHSHRHNPSRGVFNAQRFDNYPKAVQLASEIHPKWHRCSESAQQLHSRNVYQILGPDMSPETYSGFVVCWAIPDIHGVPEGGTRTAWKIAERYKIPRYNLAVKDDRKRIMDWLEPRRAA